MRARYRLVLGSALVPILVSAFFFAGQTPSTGSGTIKNKVILREIAYETGKAVRPKWAQKVSSGLMYDYLQVAGLIPKHAVAGTAGPAAGVSTLNTQGCSQTLVSGTRENVKVNQDCSFRRQAEEFVAVNPNDTKNIIAGQNDSRLGYNQCGYDFTFDGGRTWGDFQPPFHQVLFPNIHVGDFCSDPTGTFDSAGNAYIAGLELSLDGLDSAIVVAKSNAGIGGAFYHSPDSALGSFQTYADTPMGIPVLDENANIANDKELMASDNGAGSSKNGNLYMIWTRFNFDTGQGVGANSPIDFSQSTDGGFTWSAPLEISGSNTTFCTAFSGESNPNACDQDQGGDPTVGPDGTVYVTFGNGNTPTLGINQHMVVSCPATKDCSLAASWTGPVKVSDDFGLQPVASVTDPVTGCPAGRQCIPPNGYRMDDFVEGSISADSSGNLYVVWADGRNLGANCQGDYAVATSPCNNDVFYAFSTNGGATWSSAIDVTPSSVDGDTAQWMPWGAVAPDGSSLFVGYYDRSYRSCETNGCNDITLATVSNPTGASSISYRRITTKSMPNLVVANNPYQAGFLGDYMWVTTDVNGNPYLVWADTRGRAHAVEENNYFSK
jgi:hypothetical protein